MSEQPAGAALPAQKASTQTAASSEGTDTPTRPIPSPGHTEKIETNDSGTSPAIPLSDLEAAAPAAASASAGSPAAGTSAVTANAAASSEDAVAQRRKITCLADVTPLRPPFYGFTPQDWALWLNAEASSLTGTGASASWTSNVTKFSKAFDSGLLASLPSIYSDLDEALQREIMSAIQLLPAASIAKHQEALRALAHHSRSLADSSATHGQQARSAPDLNELRASMLLASSPTQFDASVAAMARSMLPSASTLGDNDSSTIAEAAAREAGEKHERDPAPSPAMLPEDLVGLDSLSINPTVPHLHQHQKRIDAHIRDGAVCGFAEEVEKLDGNADGLSRQEKSDSMETRNKAVSAALDLAAIRDILAMNPEVRSARTFLSLVFCFCSVVCHVWLCNAGRIKRFLSLILDSLDLVIMLSAPSIQRQYSSKSKIFYRIQIHANPDSLRPRYVVSFFVVVHTTCPRASHVLSQ